MLRVDAIDAAGYRERNDRFWREKPARWSSEQILSLFAEIRARNAFLMKKKKRKETSETSRLRNPSRLSRNVDREGEIDYSSV